MSLAITLLTISIISNDTFKKFKLDPLKVLNAQQLREADAYTIQHEPITAIDLMKRAAQQCASWLLNRNISEKQISIFCGKGGNGGDGLAIARLLTAKGINLSVYILETGAAGTPEFQTNLDRLRTLPVSTYIIESDAQLPDIRKDALLIDALYGFGLTRPLEGLSAALVNHLNDSGAEIIAIDLPSGLFADRSSTGNTIVKASYTLSFECYKLGLLVAENAPFIGAVHILPIQLHPQFLESVQTGFQIIDKAVIKTLFKRRNRFAHKGTFGHALIIGGSYGKIGAVVLATTSCLRSGAGLVTSYLPKCGYEILQATAPEAMTLTDTCEKMLTQVPDNFDPFSAIGIGPGMGTATETANMLQVLLQQCKKPMVLDADALNLLSKQQTVLSQLFQNTILTPHPKEFERLFGTSRTEFDRIKLALQKASELNVVLVLKGHHTLVALPGGNAFFNINGNAGMAKGGSGDVLTGIITALLAQGYEAAHAAMIGVYIHGRAGDIAAGLLSQEAMTAQDLSTYIGKVFLELND